MERASTSPDNRLKSRNMKANQYCWNRRMQLALDLLREHQPHIGIEDSSPAKVEARLRHDHIGFAPLIGTLLRHFWPASLSGE